MNTKSDASLRWFDLHSHCLPGMDDGAENVEMSLRMLHTMKGQGVDWAALTPHYYPHKEELVPFINRREAAFRRLIDRREPDLPELVLGAEIYIVRGLSEQDLRPLCIGGTRLLLLELPRQSYKPWILEELQNITYALDIIPVLAHVERYLSWYGRRDFEELLSFEELVLQCNAESLLDRRLFRFLYTLASEGYPMVLGSDAHNTGDRAPRFAEAQAALSKKRKGQMLLSCLQKGMEVLTR